jgi:hypothetical protein
MIETETISLRRKSIKTLIVPIEDLIVQDGSRSEDSEEKKISITIVE